jgi:glucose-1-phosphate cytidylyltransferase
MRGQGARVKAVILAGGLGTRLSEETGLRPKPMVEVGGRPILWHIMKIYSGHGITDFVICLGYRGYMVKEYFANYALHQSDVTFDLASGTMQTHVTSVEPWRITLVDTGADTLTGGRLLRVAKHLGEETFCMTYGDGVGDVDIAAAVRFHRSHGRAATLTATQPPGRFGRLHLDAADAVTYFEEKPEGEAGWINGGFFVLEPRVLSHIAGDRSSFESDVLVGLAAAGELAAWRHHGFWLPMDTLRDRTQLDQLWSSGQAPWKTWAD